jgi:redox-sensitive bicupin YhaK (pirin superfamily)
MTAGSGILHIETPPEHLVASGGLFHGLQLWVNLPSTLKYVAPPGQHPHPDHAGARDAQPWRLGEPALETGLQRARVRVGR